MLDLEIEPRETRTGTKNAAVFSMQQAGGSGKGGTGVSLGLSDREPLPIREDKGSREEGKIGEEQPRKKRKKRKKKKDEGKKAVVDLANSSREEVKDSVPSPSPSRWVS